MIPVYRHENHLPKMLDQLRKTGIPIVVVDDGNPIPISVPKDIFLIRFERNQGKGTAIRAGFAWAEKNGFTHLIQIDADGQHNVSDAMELLKIAEKNQDALVSGFPAYDESVPKARESGRKVTRFFLRLEIGLTEEDGMCGCRVYPVRRSLAVAKLIKARRMGFDVEFPVRWFWSGWKILTGKIRVTYPEDGFSNFRMWKDNIAFFCLHSRLCFLRLFRCYRKARAGNEK